MTETIEKKSPPGYYASVVPALREVTKMFMKEIRKEGFQPTNPDFDVIDTGFVCLEDLRFSDNPAKIVKEWIGDFKNKIKQQGRDGTVEFLVDGIDSNRGKFVFTPYPI